MNTWQPSASLATLKLRATLLKNIRDYFQQQDVLEVETPYLSHAANTDVHIQNMQLTDASASLFLHTSPEFPMKRLLAAGSGSIYQICKVFRGAEQGRLHNPEFTMLEWYRVGYNMMALIRDVECLVRQVCDGHIKLKQTNIISYQELFQSELDIDPLNTTQEQLQYHAAKLGIADAERLELDGDAWLDLIMSTHLIPALGMGCMNFVYGYPASQAALARLDPDNSLTAQRFELFINGIELANGYYELRDATEQAQRFENDQFLRQQQGKASVPADDNLIAALQHGLPDSAGVALGLDRLLLVMTGVESLDEVMAFDSSRA